MKPEIRSTQKNELAAVRALALDAFGPEEGEEIAHLMNDLVTDVTAQPLLSLAATVDGRVIGHILFSRVELAGTCGGVSARLLAPLAVHPEFQSKGVGRRLVLAGMERLKQDGVGLVFVLGHPGYYPRFGFVEAGAHGLEAPYPILPENAEAWMVHALHPGLLGEVGGRVICADSLADPRYWQE